MIFRPFTIITSLLFVLSGAMMFVVKHQSQMLDQQLSDTNQATTQDEQSIRVLQAQWALEADPSRLASLAAEFTGLQPMKPGQLVTMADLGSSLPAPGAKPPGTNPDDPVPAMPQLAAAAPAPAVPGTPANPTTSAVAPVQMAAAAAPAAQTATAVVAQPVAAPVHLAAATVPVPAVPHHRATTERLASVAAVHHVVRRDSGSALYLADASNVSSSTHAVSVTAPSVAAPMGAQFVPVRAVASPAPAPADDGGSMLGMAQGGSQ
jgi:hypothetical protein